MTTPQSWEEARKIINEVYAKAMVDPSFHAEFVADPNKVLIEHGLRPAEGVRYHLVDKNNVSEDALPKSGGTDVYLAHPTPDEPVGFDVLKPENIMLNGTGTSTASSDGSASACGTSGSQPSNGGDGDDGAGSDATF